MPDPVWLPDVLREAGLQCEVYPGAFQRGHGDMGDIWGVMAHHTGSNSATPSSIAQHPTLGLASQLHLSRDGRYTLCGVGIAWHAGSGEYPGIPTNRANQTLIGIEAANDGTSGWPQPQLEAYVRGVAAILGHLGLSSSRVIGHKEWAGKSQGKWDPGGIDMDSFRHDVQLILDSQGEPVADDISKIPSLVDGKLYTRDQYVQFADLHLWRVQKMVSLMAEKQGIPTSVEELLKL